MQRHCWAAIFFTEPALFDELIIYARAHASAQTKLTPSSYLDVEMSKTSRLEKREVFQLHHNQEKVMFNCAVALCTMQNAVLMISNLTLT
jgi:hypothetical protein